ncbi:invasion associated locus B family protein [Bradyrhizobium brasilense]|uniref:invasion associated locus B family protein n=1 Tax=Bradyrhizobium brasilense TaxID=1419277 RepID=UPI0015A270DF|nr:invasion associated locus B family protein [Bradyrhizobium brasilense]
MLGQANAGDLPEQSYTKSPFIYSPALSGSPPSVPSQAASEPTPKAALGFEWASVFEQGKQVAPGDYTRTIRPFLDWTQICDAVKGRRRLCYLETVAREGGSMISWRIALAKDGRSMALFILPPDSGSAEGVTVEFGGLSRLVKPLVCDKVVCVATFPVSGPMVGLLARETSARIGFERVGQPIVVEAGLRGVGQALADLTPRPPSPQLKPKPKTATTGAVPPQAADKSAKAVHSPWENLR